MKKAKLVRRKRFNADVEDNDQFLTDNFEKIVDAYAGGFVIIGNGKILYTHKDGTPQDLIKKVKKDFPGLIPLFFRVPYPHEFICALINL